MADSHPIILFDGVCNLCNAVVRFVIKRDPAARFRFAPLQSPAAEKLLQEANLPAADLQSFLLIEDGKLYSRSTAALRVVRRLKGPVSLIYIFIVIPAFLRNAVYRLIASNRYRWFGRTETCMIPTPALQARFLN